MKVINVKDKDFRQAFNQVRRWFLGNPNRRRAYLQLNEFNQACHHITHRNQYLTELSK